MTKTLRRGKQSFSHEVQSHRQTFGLSRTPGVPPAQNFGTSFKQKNTKNTFNFSLHKIGIQNLQIQKKGCVRFHFSQVFSVFTQKLGGPLKKPFFSFSDFFRSFLSSIFHRTCWRLGVTVTWRPSWRLLAPHWPPPPHTRGLEHSVNSFKDP